MDPPGATGQLCVPSGCDIPGDFCLSHSECCDFPGNGAQRFDGARLSQVHEGADVQTPGGGMSVETGSEPVPVEYPLELARVLTQPPRIDRRVFNEGDRTLIPLAGGAE